MPTIRERKGRDGKTSYFVEVRIKGCPPVRRSFDRKTDAKKWAQDRESDIRHRRNFGSRESLKYTFNDLMTRYLEKELPKRNSDHQKFETHLAWWNQHLGHHLLADITSPMINEVIDTLSTESIQKGPYCEKVKRKPATIKLYIATLSIVFSIAEGNWGWIERNPVKSVSKPKVKNARTRFLDEEEQKSLLKAAEADSNPYILNLIVLALGTGARWTELTHLTWREVDLKSSRPTIRLERTKNGEKRAIPLTGKALHALQQRKIAQTIHSPYVFPSADGKRPMAMRKAWQRVLEVSEINNFTFHDLRHTTASRLAMNGASLLEIAQVLGHKTLAMVKRYSHLTEQHTHNIMEKVNAQHL